MASVEQYVARSHSAADALHKILMMRLRKSYSGIANRLPRPQVTRGPNLRKFNLSS